ncbi:hypothetical protein ACFU5O_33275 [Streptomyces sp. NPDC057445]|uniref:hypothetical protein n=1 Tax=Streptomyces sp. NPDC057445 TaxID=3346136 RepID=UPI0036BE9365
MTTNSPPTGRSADDDSATDQDSAHLLRVPALTGPGLPLHSSPATVGGARTTRLPTTAPPSQPPASRRRTDALPARQGPTGGSGSG